MTGSSSNLVRSAVAILVLLPALWLVGSLPSLSSRQETDNEIISKRLNGYKLYQQGRYQDALQVYQQLLTLAEARGQSQSSVKLLNNIGSLQFALFHYDQAISAYVSAKRIAEARGRMSAVAVIDLNLASLYILLGHLDAADQAAGEAIRFGGDFRRIEKELKVPNVYGRSLACIAWLRAKQRNRAEAVRYFRQAIAAISETEDRNSLANAWDHLGEQMLAGGDTQAAEGPLLEAFRLRKLFKDRDLRVSYVKLAWLRLAQHDPHSADILLTEAESLPHTDLGEPEWRLVYLRGKIFEERHEPALALERYRTAMEQGFAWQERVGTMDVLRTSSSADEAFQDLYRALAETSLQVDPALAMDAFTATERFQASALLATLKDQAAWQRRASPEYRSLLDKLHTAQGIELAGEDKSAKARVLQLRHRLMELDTNSGLDPLRTVGTKTFEKNSAVVTLRSIQESLITDDALLTLYLGERYSAVWATSKTRHKLYLLAPGKEILSQAQCFRKDVETHAADRDQHGQALYTALFGKLDAGFQAKKNWVMSWSHSGLEIPVGALVVDQRGNHPVYLVEQHVIIRTPSALMLTPAPLQPAAGPFLGVADAIYNRADVRLRKPATLLSFVGLFSKPLLQLPRLAGSETEILACSRRWNHCKSILLTGKRAGRASFEAAVRQNRPEIIHIAAHVLAPINQPETASIDLGLTPNGEPDVLTNDDIRGLQEVKDATVVMSGCSSGTGKNLGSEFLGLARAWLIAGARAVVGSRWPTPDDSGELFQSFYGHLEKGRNEATRMRAVAKALSLAQIDMLHSSTWRSDPQYWSAFYVLGKE